MRKVPPVEPRRTGGLLRAPGRARGVQFLGENTSIADPTAGHLAHLVPGR
ncbi:hypothetical protein ACQP1V_22715 [Microtetraspora malaysiensis]